jgi:hypothetical protein
VGGHQLVAPVSGLGAAGQVLLPDRPEDGPEGRLAGLDHPTSLPERRIGEFTDLEGQPAKRTGNVAQQLTGARVGEGPVGLLDEHAVPGQQPEQPLQRVRIGMDGIGQISQRARPGGQQIGMRSVAATDNAWLTTNPSSRLVSSARSSCVMAVRIASNAATGSGGYP